MVLSSHIYLLRHSPSMSRCDLKYTVAHPFGHTRMRWIYALTRRNGIGSPALVSLPSLSYGHKWYGSESELSLECQWPLLCDPCQSLTLRRCQISSISPLFFHRKQTVVFPIRAGRDYRVPRCLIVQRSSRILHTPFMFVSLVKTLQRQEPMGMPFGSLRDIWDNSSAFRCVISLIRSLTRKLAYIYE